MADIDGRYTHVKAAMLKGRSEAAEWLLRRKDGAWLPVEVNANILPDGQWQGFMRDISSRKAQQAERDALFEQMERERRWLRDGETVIAQEYMVRRPDGTDIPVLGSAAPIADSSRMFIRERGLDTSPKLQPTE